MKTKKKSPAKRPAKRPANPTPATSVLAGMYVKKKLVTVDPDVLEKAASRPKPPPPPPKKPAAPAIAPNSVLNQLPMRPANATVVQYSRPAMRRHDGGIEPPLVIVVPANACGDFSSFTHGTVRWGYMRGPDEVADFVHVNADGEVSQPIARDGVTSTPTPPKPPGNRPPPPPPGGIRPTPPPPPPPAARTARGPREGVCAFIDALIMEGGRTAEEVRDLVLAQFPNRDPKATLSTVKTRPAHIKAKGLVPPPFKKE